MAENFIGCKISLISKAQARYEGILSAVDVVNTTVTLQNGERATRVAAGRAQRGAAERARGAFEGRPYARERGHGNA